MNKASDNIDQTALYSSIIIHTFVKLLKKKYPYVNVLKLLADAGMESYQVEDEGHWFSQEQVDRFHELMVSATGNINIAKEAGRFSASPEAIGTMTRYLLGLIGPAKVFEIVEKLASGYTRSAVYTSKKTRSNEIVISVTPHEGIQEKPYQCENRIGYFEAAVRLFQEKLPRIEHIECIFMGGKSCRYRISWQASPATVWKRSRNTAAFAAAGFLLYSALALPSLLFKPVSIALICFLAVFTFLSERFERRELIAAIKNLRSSSDHLLDTLRFNYNHALMINEIGQTISKKIQIDEILSGVTEVLKKRLDYDRGLLLLANRDRTFLRFKSGYGYTPAQMDVLESANFHLNKPESRGILVLCYRDKTPFLVNDVEAIVDDLSLRSLEFAKKMGSKSFICCPIIYEEECLGVLAVDNKITKRPLLQSDINLLMGIAPEIGISIRNALLIEGQEQQFLSILQTLAASIDARDFLTAGHSQKVTEYALGICGELRLSREFTEMIQVSSQLHDYGKIGIGDSILKKAGPLDPMEREEIKTHAEKTEAILKRINFEGIYREVPMIAGSHHERIDGSGYPRGLKGEQIPLGARIIAVADYFEAITAKRHYRDPMPIEEAISTIQEASGKHLDCTIVNAFLRYLRGSTQFTAPLNGERTLNREPPMNGAKVHPETGSSPYPSDVFVPQQPIIGV